MLFRNRSGRLELDGAASLTFKSTGMVSSAVFTDLDNDGFPELVLACEWGPVRVFHNVRGERFDKRPPRIGLGQVQRLVEWGERG